MALQYSATLRTSRLQAVLDAIDGGAGPGVLEIGTAGFGAVLAEVPLADPAGSVSGDTLTFTMPQTDPAANATGTAAAARIKDSNGTVIVDGLTVGTSGADLIVGDDSFEAGQPITINTAAINHPT